MTNSLEIISSTLLDALVRGDGSISGSSSQVLAILVGDVLALAILVALSQTKINDIDVISGRFSSSNQEIIRLDISVNNALFMHLFDSLNELDGDHEYCF